MRIYPFVSIIMPVYNEYGFLPLSLGSVLAQDYPPEYFEIIVVDGLSGDGSREYIRKAMQEHPKIRLVDNPEKIVPYGMNRALRCARGDIIIRVDGHCEIAPDYVRRCVDHIITDEVDGVGGSMVTIGSTSLARTIAIGMSSPFGVGNSAFRTTNGKSMLVDSVPFPAYTRQIVDSAGYYDEELIRNQDDEYNYRLRKLGARLLLAGDVHSQYYSRSSLRSLWRQYFQYGYWKVRVLQKHPLQMRPRQFVPPVFVASLLGLLPFALATPFFRIILSVFIGAYILINLAVSIYTAYRKGRQHLTLLPVVFTLLHFSYGLGFLFGLAKFWNRWGDKNGKVPVLGKAVSTTNE